MSNYHAYLSGDDLLPDEVLLITGGVGAVDLRVSDRLTIDCGSEARIDAVVLERGDGTMLIAIAEGRSVALRITNSTRSSRIGLPGGFSRQCWVVL